MLQQDVLSFKLSGRKVIGMGTVVWLFLLIAARWIVLHKSGFHGILSIVPFLGNFCLAKSAGRSDMGAIRLIAGAAALFDLFLVFAAAGKYDTAVSNSAISFIDYNILGGEAFLNSEDVLIIQLLILFGAYLTASIIISVNLCSNWGYQWKLAVMLILLEPIGLSIMAFGHHKPLVRYV